MLTTIRSASQQLSNPEFDSPKELVTWMGAIQAQDYTMVKWAVGIRLKSATIQTVEKALRQGEIVRTHVMRPTWHLVAAEDIRWMLKLSAQRIKAANQSFGKDLEITESLHIKCNSLIEKMLEGNKSLTKQEIDTELSRTGILTDARRTSHFIRRAETEGIVCSGIDKGNKPTYTLLEERIPPVKELYKDEALALLATRYFRSHSPASLNDFTWWSGLSITEARQAMGLIEPELITDKFGTQTLFVHQLCNKEVKPQNTLHFLPSYDEYLISYKDRTAALPTEHHPKAFNTFGIFYPVIMHNGRIIGNWKKFTQKGNITVETSFFGQNQPTDCEHIKNAENRYKTFISPDRKQ